MLGIAKVRQIITTLFVDHQTAAEVAVRCGVHRSWVYRCRDGENPGGETAF